MRTLFITAGDETWGSSRIRSYWVAEHMDADVVTIDEVSTIANRSDYDAYVFQKIGSPGTQRNLIDLGKQVWLDQCDPMWWFSPDACREMFANCHGVAVSSQNLGNDLNEWLERQGMRTDVHLIHDRMNLEHYDRVKEDYSINGSTRFIWYGASQNRVGIIAAWANLSRLEANGFNIEFTVFDDRPDIRFNPGEDVPISQQQWRLDREVQTILNHDIVLLPPYPGPWGDVKSENKRRTAMACGMPYTTGEDYYELIRLINNQELRESFRQGRKDVEELWDVRRSAREWERLLDADV